jgi:hypothetical protein
VSGIAAMAAHLAIVPLIAFILKQMRKQVP